MLETIKLCSYFLRWVTVAHVFGVFVGMTAHAIAFNNVSRQVVHYVQCEVAAKLQEKLDHQAPRRAQP